ncbi:MAG: hypothetical protein O3A00_09790 [Planctomycetota bacterium]|nr:hypothetical protein [Planctomycetota bacterium]
MTFNHFQRAVWWIAIPAGIVAVLWALIYKTTGLSVAFGILAVIAWFGIAWVFGWVLGVARVAKAHLNIRANHADALAHYLDKLERINVIRALEACFAEQSLQVSARDLDNAIREIVTSGGTLTKNLLGYEADAD